MAESRNESSITTKKRRIKNIFLKISAHAFRVDEGTMIPNHHILEARSILRSFWNEFCQGRGLTEMLDWAREGEQGL